MNIHFDELIPVIEPINRNKQTFRTETCLFAIPEMIIIGIFFMLNETAIDMQIECKALLLRIYFQCIDSILIKPFSRCGKCRKDYISCEILLIESVEV